MKHVQESLYQFEDAKFFGNLNEAEEKRELSPAEKKAKKDELQKQGMSVVQKCLKNFDSFRKHAGDIWQEYRDFWSTQKDADESVSQKGMFYNLWESDYIVGVVKEATGTAALKVYNTSASDEDEYVAFSCTNPEVVQAFNEFLEGTVKFTMKDIIERQKAAMAAKKTADETRQKEEVAAKKKAKLDAFLGESSKGKKKLNEGSYEDFFMNYGSEIKNALDLLRKLGKKIDSGEITEEKASPAIDKIDSIYDGAVVNYIVDTITSGGRTDARELTNIAIDNMNRQGTEMQMILYAIEEFAAALGVYSDQDED
ncbi:MAG TPA: hypothetical protein VMW50_00365 [Dehalococcoidia bacterium]|nr:hypothetical protein [Dehalococcoidia bacterium]